MEKFVLNAQPREILGRKVKNLRKNGLIPAVIYGGKKGPISITLNKVEFEKTYNAAGSTSLVQINTDKIKDNVLIQEPQYDPVSGGIYHVDLTRVNMEEKIKTEIPIVTEGESIAVEQEGGTLVTPRDNIEVECLPGDLVHEIKIDISILKTFNDQIKVGDITPPPGVEFITDADEVLALVEPPRSEEELAELEKPTSEEETEAVEAVAGEKEETEEGAEPTAEETPAEETTPQSENAAKEAPTAK